jgi:hypothetical protein
MLCPCFFKVEYGITERGVSIGSKEEYERLKWKDGEKVIVCKCGKNIGKNVP